MEFLNTITNFNPFSKRTNKYYSKYYYHEKLLNKFKSIDAYIELIKRAQDRVSVPTQKTICYTNNIQFGEKYKTIKKQLPRLNHIVSNQEDTKIRFYRIKIGGHRVKMELHFYKDCLIYYSYTFSHLKEEDKSSIQNIIRSKYQIKDAETNLTELTITDDSKNILFLEDNIDLVIHYFSQQNSFIKNINKIKSNEARTNKKESITRSKDLYSKL